MKSPLAFDPSGHPVHSIDGLPSIPVPSVVQVTDDDLLVDGWRLPLEGFNAEVAGWMILHLKTWDMTPGAGKFAREIGELVLDRLSKPE